MLLHQRDCQGRANFGPCSNKFAPMPLHALSLLRVPNSGPGDHGATDQCNIRSPHRRGKKHGRDSPSARYRASRQNARFTAILDQLRNLGSDQAGRVSCPECNPCGAEQP